LALLEVALSKGQRAKVSELCSEWLQRVMIFVKFLV
jgi:hypothetical protein